MNVNAIPFVGSALGRMILDPDVPIDAIAEFLDGSSSADRWKQVSKLGATEQRELYEKAAKSEPLELDFFVPADVDSLQPVRHKGRNTLPLVVLNHRFFAKVFTRTESGAVCGFNDSPAGSIIGPGYFVVTPTERRLGWQHRGAVVVDYYQVPKKQQMPEGWPKVVSNAWGLQHFVYHHTRDFMRRVSKHVSIGAAYKNERPMDIYLTLCRQ